jgi:hypothetical protein
MFVCHGHLGIPYGKPGEALAPLIVPGRPHGVVYRLADERRG